MNCRLKLATAQCLENEQNLHTATTLNQTLAANLEDLEQQRGALGLELESARATVEDLTRNKADLLHMVEECQQRVNIGFFVYDTKMIASFFTFCK